MTKNKYLLAAIIWSAAFTYSFAQNQATILEVPGVNQFCRIDQQGTSVLPSGRYVTPAGTMVCISHDPFGLALSPDGKKAVTLHDGVLTLIDLTSMDALRVPSYDKKIVSPLKEGAFLGVAFAPDSKTVYLSGGDSGAIIIYDTEKLQRIDSLSLNGVVNGRNYEDSFTSDLLLNESNNELLVLDRGNFRLVRMDITTKKITASIPQAGSHLAFRSARIKIQPLLLMWECTHTR